MYQKVFFEISGKCQAKCPHCCTGNRSLKEHPSRFIDVSSFVRAVDRLLSFGLVNSNTQFELYNWGEPFLNPELPALLDVLVKRGLSYRLSTNCGHYVKLPDSLKDNLNELTITIPGFSQASYDKVHGFDFQKILSHINQYIQDFGSEKIRITYLIHQFNIDEIPDVYKYFKKRNVKLLYTVAYLNDYNMARDYLSGQLKGEKCVRISKDLLLYYLDDLLESVPSQYKCPQLSILSLDEYCNVLTCCAVPKGHPDYSLGSVFDLSREEIVEGKRKRNVCKECSKLGIHYWIHTAPKPDFWPKMTGEGIRSVDLLIFLKRNLLRELRAFWARFSM